MTPLMLPTELWIKIALHSPRSTCHGIQVDPNEHVFNSLARAIPALGRWTIAGHNGIYNDSVIIDRRLDLMLAFGYSVEIRSTTHYVYGYRNDRMGMDHGCIVWKKDGRIHRNDGPATISAVGDLYVPNTWCTARYTWQYHGHFHRVGGPSNESLNSCQSWNLYGDSCRCDGPAEMGDHSLIAWYQGDDSHRVDGPAFIGSDGDITWYAHDERHRIGGPALIWPNRERAYSQYGKRVPR